MHTVRVWDLPTRLFHWALVACVIGQIVTANVGGNWMNWHLRLGYTVLTLLLFRLVWGFVGGHWSRFSSFLYGPTTVLNYLRGRARPEHRVGHNPQPPGGVLRFWPAGPLVAAGGEWPFQRRRDCVHRPTGEPGLR